MSDKELKPCPFCGAEAECYERYPGRKQNWWCGCKCHCTGFYGETSAKAIAAWNTRPSPWVSVNDRLPEKRNAYPENFSVEVLVVSADGYTSIGSYDYDEHIWRSYRNITSETVTHWAQIPETPNEV